MADNATHSFWYDNLTTATSAGVSWTRTYNFNPTKIDTVPEDALDGYTDVVARDSDYEGAICMQTWQTGAAAVGIAGYTLCNTLVGAVCQQFILYFDTDFMGPRSTADESWLACHEVGHSVGLSHTFSGAYCMLGDGIGTASLTTHDADHLSANY